MTKEVLKESAVADLGSAVKESDPPLLWGPEPDGDLRDGLTRRQLLLGGGMGLVGIAAPELLSGPMGWADLASEADAATPRLTRGKLSHLQGIADVGGMVRGQGVNRPGVVFEVRHQSVFPLGGYVPAQGAVNRMVAKLMARLTREPTGAKAWSKMFGSGDKVGILVDAEGKAATRTRKAVVMAVLRGLLKAGVSANDIIVWTTFGRQLPSIGFNLNWQSPGIKFVGADQIGYDRRYPLKGTGGGGLLGGSSNHYLSKIVSRACTHIINIASLEDHPIIGARMCLAQQTVSSFSKGKMFERYWGGAKGIGQVAGMPMIKSRFVLHIIDGLAANFNGALNPWRPQLLLGSTDPVAIDRVGFALIESKRRQAGVPAITGTRRTPAYINNAALNGAGRANIQQIGHAKIILK